MKVKNAFIIFSILYVVVLVVCAFVELENVVTTCADIRSTVSLAADMALQQATASDEMFNSIATSTQVGVNDVSDITLIGVAKHGDTDYTYKNIFELTYGKDVKTTAQKEELFKTMYFDTNNCVFARNTAFLNDLFKISTSINGWEIPNIVQIGLLDTDYPQLSTVNNNAGVSSYLIDLAKQGYNADDWLELKSVRKEYYRSDGQKDEYFLAPTNIGVTYIDQKILQNAFICNMDLLMRASLKGIDEDSENGVKGLTVRDGVNLSTGGQGVGIEDTNDLISTYNIIHNQNMVFIKGRYNANGGYSVNDYSRPHIEYKVIDICDVANADLVKLSLGYNGSSYTDWLEGMGLEAGVDNRYICVAKVTVFADVLVSYETPLLRQVNNMYTRYLQSGTTNSKGETVEIGVADYSDQAKRMAKLQCIPYTNAVNDTARVYATSNNAAEAYRISEASGNVMYAYTTYYAIM